MVTTTFLMALALQVLPIIEGRPAEANQEPITPADVPVIIDSIVSNVLQSHPGYLGGSPEDRPLILTEASLDAFRQAVPGFEHASDQGKRHMIRGREATFRCASEKCQVVDNGVVVHIRYIMPQEPGHFKTPGDYEVFALVQYTRPSEEDGVHETGMVYSMSKVGPREWKVMDSTALVW